MARKILLVAMSDSIHTARWIRQFAGQPFDLHLFPSVAHGASHGELNGCTVHHGLRKAKFRPGQSRARDRGLPVPGEVTARLASNLINRYFPGRQLQRLCRLIERGRFDAVHALELQHAGYLCADAKARLGSKMPPLILSNWGCDISLFQDLPDEAPKIRRALMAADYFTAECRRDYRLARAHGFSGAFLPCVPAAGGLDVDALSAEFARTPPSQRKLIVIKGYQNWAGRALFALKAVEKAAVTVRRGGFEVAIFLPEDSVSFAGRLLEGTHGIPVRCIGRQSHREMMRLYGQARVYIGLSIGDGISTSFLEAIAMGAFPIQSDSSCGGEWIESGKSGFLAPAEDDARVAECLEISLTDDELVDRSQVTNVQTVREKADATSVAEAVAAFYLDPAAAAERAPSSSFSPLKPPLFNLAAVDG